MSGCGLPQLLVVDRRPVMYSWKWWLFLAWVVVSLPMCLHLMSLTLIIPLAPLLSMTTMSVPDFNNVLLGAESVNALAFLYVINRD